MRRLGLGNDHDAGRVLIQPVYQARPRKLRERGIVPQERILQSVARISGARVHDEAGRLIDDQHVGILVGQAQLDCLCLYRAFGLLLSHLDPDSGSRLDQIAGSGALPAHQHGAFLNPALDSGTGMLRQQTRQCDIKARPGQFRRNFEIDHLELWDHMGTRSYRRGIGYTAALSGPPRREGLL